MERLLYRKIARRFLILKEQYKSLLSDLWIEMTNSITNMRNTEKVGDELKVLIFIHAFGYTELQKIIKNLNNIKIPLSLIISLPNALTSEEVNYWLDNLVPNHAYQVFQVNNVGRDISPFVENLIEATKTEWDLIIKIHTKQSQKLWFHLLIRSLIRDDGRIRALANRVRNFPQDIFVHPLLRYPGHSRSSSEPGTARLLQFQMDQNIQGPTKWFFPAGSMFALSQNALIDLRDNLELFGNFEFEAEEFYSQGSMAHVLENYFGFQLYLNNHILRSTSFFEYFDLRAWFIKLK